MYKPFLFLLCMLSAAPCLRAQTAVDSVKAVISQLFDAMRRADGVALKKCFTDSIVLQTVARNAKGETLIRSESVEGFIQTIAGLPPQAADERIEYDVVRTDGVLAIAWTPYRFYMNGQFSHCGVNSFQLIRINGAWKIAHIIDTRRRQGCE